MKPQAAAGTEVSMRTASARVRSWRWRTQYPSRWVWIELSMTWLTWAPESEKVMTAAGWRRKGEIRSGSSEVSGWMKNWPNPVSTARSIMRVTGSVPRRAASTATLVYGGRGRSIRIQPLEVGRRASAPMARR